VKLPFTFRETGGVAHVEGALQLDRPAFDLGMASDPSAQWVSKAIGVQIEAGWPRAAKVKLFSLCLHPDTYFRVLYPGTPIGE
jgi:hypothetical protein